MPDKIPLSPPVYIASKLGKDVDPALVDKVWKEAIRQKMDPLLVIALVDHETGGKWDPDLVGEADPSDYGLFQLNKRWHNQHVGDVDAHITEGVTFLRKSTDLFGAVGGLSYYNSGSKDSHRGLNYAGLVLSRYKPIQKLMKDFWSGLRQTEFKFGG